jgi:hypothetical protein
MKKEQGHGFFSFRRSLSFWAAVLAAFLLMPMAVLGQAGGKLIEAEYMPPSKAFPSAVTWIGALEGTWREMGIQYGQRAAKDVRNNTDVEWLNSLTKLGNSPQRIMRLSAAFEAQIDLLCPEVLEMLKGMAEGAATEMNKSVYASQASNYQRILNLQWDMLIDPRYEKLIADAAAASGAPAVEIASASDTTRMYPSLDPSEEDCNGWWVSGLATKDGLTYATRHSQGGSWHTKSTNQVAFVLVPSDPRAAVTFALCPAGEVGTGQVFNEYGVYLGWGAGGTKAPLEEWAAIGVPNYIYNLPAVVWSKTAREAVDYITRGTEKYRQLTGRKTLLRERSVIQMYCDEKEVYVVEQAARRYAIRTPGYMGEKNKSFIAWANHDYTATGSYDENNVLNPKVHMKDLVPEQEKNSSYYRFWTQMAWFNKNYGNITLDMLMNDLSAAHYAYDKAGNRIDPDPKTGMPTAPGTVCVHGRLTEVPSFPKGTQFSFVIGIAVPSTREIYYIPAMPCEWVRHDWFYCDLKLYAAYRQAVYGK